MMAALFVAIGFGGMLLSRLLNPGRNSYGPRLADVNVPSVSPGQPITRLWGTMKLAGQILWVSRLVETAHVQNQQQGGKGGGGKGPTATTYTYAVDVAVGICRGPVYQINRIWANQKILWINPNLAAVQQSDFDAAFVAEFTFLVQDNYYTDYDYAYASAYFFATNNYSPGEYTYGTQTAALAYIETHVQDGYPISSVTDLNNLLGQMLDGLGHYMQYATYKMRYDQLDLYLGSETQLPNPQIESWIGMGNVPGYRGLVYFVMHNLALEDFGDAVPTFTVEVQAQQGGHKVQLCQVISDICEEAGLVSGQDFDAFSNMDTSIEMDGFALTASTTARDAINMLQKVFPFDAAETNFMLMFNWINYRPTMVLDRNDFGAHIEGEASPPSLEIKRISDLDLPKRINLKYQEKVRNFSINMAFAQRMCTESQTVDDREVTIALDRVTAKTYAEEQLALAFCARRTYKIFLPRKYVIIEPGDVVLIPDDTYPDTLYSVRCTEVHIGNNGIIEATFIDHFYHVLTNAVVADDSLGAYDAAPSKLPLKSPTIPYLLDCPLITDGETDNVGYYVVLGGVNNNWIGGVLLIDMGTGSTVTAFNDSTSSSSSGAAWVQIAASSVQSACGISMNTLDANCHPMMWDRKSRISVYLNNPGQELVSATEDDLLTQPINLAMFGDEIVQFANAVHIGNNLWQLDTFLRGLRGTEAAIKTHVSGERFIRLMRASTTRVVHDQRYLNTSETYQSQSYNTDMIPDNAFAFTDTGNSLKPRAPQITKAIVVSGTGHDPATGVDLANGDIWLTWLPRARQNGNMLSGKPVLLDQAVEAYEIDVYVGTTLKKTYSIGATRYWTYTAAMQTADAIAANAHVTLNLYELGAIIGRGYVSQVQLIATV
jgi:hypothetical protein